MRVLTFTSLFPNQIAVNLGGFVARRMEAWAARYGERWAVVAPVPWFPTLPVRSRWDAYSRVPRLEKRQGWTVAHPRYPMLPGVSTRLQGASMGRFSFRAVRELWEREGPFDLIDSHFVYPDGYAASLVARRLGVPLVVSARGSDVNFYPDLPGIRSKISETLRSAGAVVGVSRSLVDRMVELGAPPELCRVVANGVDLEAFSPRAGSAAGSAVRSLLAVGNLVPEKGLDLLIEALAGLDSAHRDVTLTIVGAGPELAALRARAEALGLAGRVRFAGAVPHQELPGMYRAADALCLPSRREGCPNVVLEALATGLPVCGTPVGAVPDLVREGVNGTLADDVSARALRAALERLLSRRWDPCAIRGTVEGMSWEGVADRLQGVFESVVPKAGQQTAGRPAA